MSERERWIVYPLLFLALGAGLRDKLFDQTTSKRIVCQELTVVDEAPPGREPLLLARIGRLESSATGAPAGGYLAVNGPLSVAGPVDAQAYAIRGVPLVPNWQAIVSPDFLRALQQALQQTGPREAPAPANRPAEDADASGAAPTNSPPAGEDG